MRSHGDDAPRELIDPDGEGVYVRSDAERDNAGNALYLAAERLGCHWREIDAEAVAMVPGDDEGWRPVSFRNWRWRLWPLTREPAVFLYCTPSPGGKDG